MFGVAENFDDGALLQVCVPVLYIGIVMMEAYVAQAPNETVGAHQVEQVYVRTVGPFATENRTVRRIVDRIEENKDDH